MFLVGLALFLGETNAEKTQEVSISGLNIDMCFNQSLPFLDHGAELVSGQIHAVELSQAVLALNIFADELELLVGPLGFLKKTKHFSLNKSSVWKKAHLWNGWKFRAIFFV